METEKEMQEEQRSYEVYRLTLEHYIDRAGSRTRLEEPLTVQMVIDNRLMPRPVYLNRMLDMMRDQVLRMAE